MSLTRAPSLDPVIERKRLMPAVSEALREAAVTLRRLPLAPAKTGTSWPEMVRETWINIATPTEARGCPRPDAKQIEAMNLALDWLWLLDEKQRRVIWERALGRPWSVIAALLDCNIAQARYRHTLALDRLAGKLFDQGWQVCAQSPFGKDEAEWDARDWELARTIGVAWVLRPPANPKVEV